MSTVFPQAIAVNRGAARKLTALGVTHLLTSEQTGGAYYLCEAIFAPESGSPMHIHHNEDEVIYVLEGAIDIRLAHETLHLQPGGVVHLPKKLPHALHNPLQTPLKILVSAVPGGLEHYFDEVDAAIRAGTLDQATHTRISAKYGLEWLE